MQNWFRNRAKETDAVNGHGGPELCATAAPRRGWTIEVTIVAVLLQDFPMGGGPEGGPMGPMGPTAMGPVMNGSDGLDGMKNSPANGGPGTPREDAGGSGGLGDYNLGGFGGPNENVSMTGNFFGL